MKHTDFTNVTEQPGQKASKEQLSMIMTRYNWAKEAGKGKHILEIACGSGTGLGFLSENAESILGGDIDPNLVAIARKSYKNRPKIKIEVLDAQQTGLPDNHFDLIVFFEAIYYLPDAKKFFQEAKRILKPEGQMLVSTVNCSWHGFNPSPFSIKYYTCDELYKLAKDIGFNPSIHLGFYDKPSGLGKFIGLIRILAVRLRLIPNTMEGKERLKRIFFGELQSIPSEISQNMAPAENMKPFSDQLDLQNYKQIYLTCKI